MYIRKEGGKEGRDRQTLGTDSYIKYRHSGYNIDNVNR